MIDINWVLVSSQVNPLKLAIFLSSSCGQSNLPSREIHVAVCRGVATGGVWGGGGGGGVTIRAN